MNDKTRAPRIAMALVPACITFGPLFMVMFRESPEAIGRPMSYLGAFMLMGGLAIMFRACCRLGAEPPSDPGPPRES